MVILFNKDQGLVNGSVFTWVVETGVEVLGQFASLRGAGVSRFKEAIKIAHTRAVPLRM